MRIIRFRRIGAPHWEIAFSEAHLWDKLNGETAEIIMPARAWPVRLWRLFFPLKGIEMKPQMGSGTQNNHMIEYGNTILQNGAPV